MEMNKIGKFETRQLVEAFDAALIERYGINMTDAHITRFEALAAIEESGDCRRAAELLGQRKGLVPITANDSA